MTGACARESSEASETASEQQSDAEVAQSDHEGNDQAGSAAEAYDLVIKEIRSVQKTTRDQRLLVIKVEKLFKDFIAEYPDTEEAADARLNLGQIYSQLNRNEEAIAILYELIDGGTANNEKIGFAHFVLGDAYKNADQFDKAKREYEIVVKQYAYLGRQITEMAQSNLEDLETLKRLAIGSKPIPFEVKTTDGETLSLEKLRGKVVLIDFWATWCGPCRVEMPNVVKLYKKNRKKGFEIVGVSLDRSRSAMDQYVKANEMDWPQFFDGKYWQNEIAMMYRVRSIPATYLIDRQGVIRYRALRGRELEAAVAKLLEES
jgi:peroxiredoxin